MSDETLDEQRGRRDRPSRPRGGQPESCRAGPSPGGPTSRCSITPKPSATRCSPAPMTRSSAPRSSATPTSSSACAPSSTSNCRRCTAPWRGSPTGCSAGCWRSRTAAGTSTSRKACSTPRGSPASSSTRCIPSTFKQERETEFRDTVVTLLLDNSGSMRGRPIMVAACSRRHSRPHARALRRQGGDPRLHHPRLEGRPCPRAMAQRRQAGLPRPAQRSSPHRLQIGRRAVAAVAAQSRADDARRPAEGEYRRRGAGLGA